MSATVACVIFAGSTLAFSNASAPQEQVGIRAGVGGDPVEIVFDGHIETAPLL